MTRWNSPPVIVGLTLALLLALPATLCADESADAFLALWKQAAESPENAANSAWAAFADKYPRHELASAARLLAATESLRQHDAPAARAALEPLISAAPAGESAGDFSAARQRAFAAAAKGVLARAKMLDLAQKLRAFYRKHAEYPGQLDELLAEKLAAPADLSDPFGQRFAYEARPRKLFPKVDRQTFVLSCLTINAQHADLDAVLERARQPIKGLTLSSTDPGLGQAFLRRSRPDGAPGLLQRLLIGQELGDVTLWGAYEKYVLVGWREFPIVVVRE